LRLRKKISVLSGKKNSTPKPFFESSQKSSKRVARNPSTLRPFRRANTVSFFDRVQ